MRPDELRVKYSKQKIKRGTLMSKLTAKEEKDCFQQLMKRRSSQCSWQPSADGLPVLRLIKQNKQEAFFCPRFGGLSQDELVKHE